MDEMHHLDIPICFLFQCCTIIALLMIVSFIFKSRIVLFQVARISLVSSGISDCVLGCAFQSRLGPRHQKNFTASNLCVISS